MRTRLVNSVPAVTGAALVLTASVVSGWTGMVWLTAGVFAGGYVPLYLMPWLRRRCL